MGGRGGVGSERRSEHVADVAGVAAGAGKHGPAAAGLSNHTVRGTEGLRAGASEQEVRERARDSQLGSL